VVDGQSSDKTQDIVKTYTSKNSHIRLLQNEKKYAPHAMNIGISQAQGEYIFIISAHASYSEEYFSKLVNYMKELDADCVGPLLSTEVKNKTATSITIKNVLSDKLGVGSSFRTFVSEVKEVDTVAFGCYTRDCFNKYGKFNEKLLRNQDIELNKRIKNQGGKIYIIPEVKATYYARETFGAFAKNAYENGKWNVLTAMYTKTLRSLSLRHFIPLFFLLSLLVSSILSLVSTKGIPLLIFIFVPYLLLLSLRSIQIGSTKSFPRQIYAFLVLHFSYGFGSLVGIIHVLRLFIKGFF